MLKNASESSRHFGKVFFLKLDGSDNSQPKTCIYPYVFLRLFNFPIIAKLSMNS